jgi:hypothetical protein
MLFLYRATSQTIVLMFLFSVIVLIVYFFIYEYIATYFQVF